MKCPACAHEQPMSFRCKSCGHEFMRQLPPPRSAATPAPRRPPPPPHANVPVRHPPPAVNPYAAPSAASDRSPALSTVEAAEAPLAGRGARLLAQFLDGLFAIGCILPGMLLVMAVDRSSQGLALLGLAMALVGIVGLAVYQIRMLKNEGQTWGKKKMNVRIVLYETGEIPGLGRSLGLRVFVNNLFGAIPFVGGFYGLADVLFIFGEERRCLHDRIAGTKVVEAT